MDRDYSVVYLNVVPLLSLEARRALNVVSQHTGESSRRVQRDNVFWKRRFELLVIQEYPAAKSPGTTTWQHKVESVEQRGLKSLLLSDEPLDVEAGIRVVSTESLTPEQKREIVTHALLSGNVHIVTQLASVPGVEFQRYATKDVEDGIEMQDGDCDVVIAEIPAAVLQLIIQPTFGLHIDVPRAIINNIPYASMAALAVLLNDPRALLTQNCEDYLVTAWASDRDDVFFMMLDHPDVTLDAVIFSELYDEDNEEATAEFLKHPKTAVFMQ